MSRFVYEHAYCAVHRIPGFLDTTGNIFLFPFSVSYGHYKPHNRILHLCFNSLKLKCTMVFAAIIGFEGAAGGTERTKNMFPIVLRQILISYLSEPRNYARHNMPV